MAQSHFSTSTDPARYSNEGPLRDVAEYPAAVQVKADEDQKSDTPLTLVNFKVLEFLGQKKAKGQIPRMMQQPKQPQENLESQA
ncbi:hypothetical protein H7Q97_01295 [Ochrobactrum sp. CM-21-5]|nr:hypothetical protein [Ochrobactrum sp. CM-21-5]MBC2884035.1 hypothetical protein [Ochrobactrum sp. CM-21-5]